MDISIANAHSGCLLGCRDRCTHNHSNKYCISATSIQGDKPILTSDVLSQLQKVDSFNCQSSSLTFDSSQNRIISVKCKDMLKYDPIDEDI